MSPTKPDMNMFAKNVKPRDFPGGPVVKNPAASAGDEGASPGWGTRISQAMGPLSTCTAVKDQQSQNLKKKKKIKTYSSHWWLRR